MVEDYEIFIADRNNNVILSLDKDDIYFFNTTNFTDNDYQQLKDKNIDYLVKTGLALRFDSQIIYRMYLGFINKNKCVECGNRLGSIESSKGFGDLTA